MFHHDTRGGRIKISLVWRTNASYVPTIPRDNADRYFTVKLIEDNTAPLSSVASTFQLPALTDLALQVRVDGYFRSKDFSKTFLSPRYQTCLIVAGTVFVGLTAANTTREEQAR